VPEPFSLEVASPAVRRGDWTFISGQPAVAAADAAAALAALCPLDQIVDLTVMVADAVRIEPVLAELRYAFGDALPAVLAGAWAAPPAPGAQVMLQATGHRGGRHPIPAPAGSWLAAAGIPAACRAGDVVFVSGQLPLEGDGTVLAPGDHCGQARIAYRGMLDAVAAAGGSVADIVDFTSFHHDIRGADATLQTVYGADVLGPVSDDALAATSHLGVAGLVRPGVLGSYRAIADLSPGGRVSSTPDSIWWKGVLPVAGGARKAGGSLVAIAGQVACGADGNVVGRGDFTEQARYVLRAMREVLEGFDATMEDVVSVTSFHQDIRSWPEVAAVAREEFGSSRERAWTAVGVAGLWMEGYLHEISALALVRP
jgi:enamine deaminase RidA (YjgF/YER057c/UK114 family)